MLGFAVCSLEVLALALALAVAVAVAVAMAMMLQMVRIWGSVIVVVACDYANIHVKQRMVPTQMRGHPV